MPRHRDSPQVGVHRERHREGPIQRTEEGGVSDIIPISAPSRAELWRRNQLALSILGHRSILPTSTRDALIAVLRGESVAVAEPKEVG